MNVVRTFPGIIAAAIAAVVFVTIAATYQPPATIGGHDVTNVACQEDEGIVLTPAGMSCRHYGG